VCHEKKRRREGKDRCPVDAAGGGHRPGEGRRKWLTVLPGQVCPNHYHKLIKETFFVIKGDVRMGMGDEVLDMRAGDKLTMPAGTWHTFTSDGGAIIEEVTTRQVKDDSYFEDADIQRYVTLEDG
jgi:mannose-6-phosphate isomerase-like protein (cupin superfamily)